MAEGRFVERATEFFAALSLLIIGVSHIVQRRAWVEFFVRLREAGHSGAFVNGFLSLSVGCFIVAFHNVWSGLPIVLTLFGWTQVLKGAVSFVAPHVALLGFSNVSERKFAVGGILALALSAVLWYSILTR